MSVAPNPLFLSLFTTRKYAYRFLSSSRIAPVPSVLQSFTMTNSGRLNRSRTFPNCSTTVAIISASLYTGITTDSAYGSLGVVDCTSPTLQKITLIVHNISPQLQYDDIACLFA